MRSTVAAFTLLLGLAAWPPDSPTPRVEVRSPDGQLQFFLAATPAMPASATAPAGDSPPRLTYSVAAAGRPVLLSSNAGIVLDGVDVGQGAALKEVERRPCDCVPGSSQSLAGPAASNLLRVHLTHLRSSIDYVVEVRVFDDGVAFRYEVPGAARRTPDETTTFQVPPGSAVWYHDLSGHYEGVHARRAIDQVPAGDWAAPPVTIKLPDAGGYAAITEAALINYAGMALRADGRGGSRRASATITP